MSAPSDATRCVEHSIWTPLPRAAPRGRDALVSDLEELDPAEHARVTADGAVSFQATGCTGCPGDAGSQSGVAGLLAAQAVDEATRASFLLLLGDITYKGDDQGDADGADQHALYDAQFLQMYAAYPRAIVAIAGNHDGKHSPHGRRSAIEHFLRWFCSEGRQAEGSSPTPRAPGAQPYVYHRLSTPQAELINLYANVANGGILDDPAHGRHGLQYDWLVGQLRSLGKLRASTGDRKAIVLSVHYPPFSGASNFPQRGDPTLGPTNATDAVPLGRILLDAYVESGVRPDLVLSAHNHLYQRLTYRFADGFELPHLIVGSGGHAPIESLFEACDGSLEERRAAPFDARLPAGLALPDGDGVRLVAYDDASFGFIRVTATHETVQVAYTTTDPTRVTDGFALDLASHRIH